MWPYVEFKEKDRIMCKHCKGTKKIQLLTSLVDCECVGRIDWQAQINKIVIDVKAGKYPNDRLEECGHTLLSLTYDKKCGVCTDRYRIF